LEPFKNKYNKTSCTSINLYFQDESRFGLLTVLRRMLTAKRSKASSTILTLLW